MRKNGKFICHSCKVKSYIGPVLEKRNKNSEVIKKNKSKLKQYWESDEGQARKDLMRSSEYRERLSNQAKVAWQDTEYRASHSEVSKNNVNDPKFIEMLRESSRKAWEDEVYRNTVLENMDRDAISRRSKEMWQDTKSRTKLLNVIQQRWSDEDWRKQWYDRIMSDEVRQRRAVARENSKVSLGLASSVPHLIVKDALDGLNIRYIEEYKVGFYNFDFFLVEHNILLEVHGDYWHSLEKAIIRDRAKSTYIAKYFQEYKLKTIWEHETKCKNRVINFLSILTNKSIIISDDFSFKDLNLQLITAKDADFFLSKYHYLRGVGRNALCYGALIDNKLIAVCCFASITRKETAERLGYRSSDVRELTRFCIHPSYHKKNFGSYMISRCIRLLVKEKNLRCLVSFADTTFGHNGIIYKASNWAFDGVVKPSYWYVDKEGYVMHKKTLWDHAKSLKMKEAEFAEKHGYKKIYGKEKYRYILKLNT